MNDLEFWLTLALKNRTLGRTQYHPTSISFSSNETLMKPVIRYRVNVTAIERQLVCLFFVSLSVRLSPLGIWQPLELFWVTQQTYATILTVKDTMKNIYCWIDSFMVVHVSVSVNLSSLVI